MTLMIILLGVFAGIALMVILGERFGNRLIMKNKLSTQK